MRLLFNALLILILTSQTVYAQGNKATVTRFVDAFNRHDVDAMLALVTTDIRWMSVSGQQVSAETTNHTELRNAMSAYFESLPSVKSEVRTLQESGPFVYTVEKASWESSGVTNAQCSLAIYEFSDQKIRHVWYFPEHAC